MKKLLIFYFIISLFNHPVVGQENNIDPRQFVRITELNRQTNKENDIYNNLKTKYLYVDENSLIKIQFNLDSMSKKTNYYGNVSIVAKINSESIKVSPYSKVGEKQGKIGVKTASPIDISSHLISLYKQMIDLKMIIKKIEYQIENDPINSLGNSNNQNSDYSFATEYFKNIQEDSSTFNNLPERIKLIIDYYSIFSPVFFNFYQNNSKFKNSKIYDEFLKINDDRKKKTDIFKSQNKKRTIDNYKILKRNLDKARDYIVHFQNGDKDLLDIYLRLMKQDKLFIDNFVNELTLSQKKLNLFDSLDISDKYDNNKSTYEDAVILISSPVTYYIDKFYLRMKSIGLEDLFDTESSLSLNNKNNSQQLEDKLANEVGQVIYQKLVIGNIDLREARAKVGQILTISILWYQNNDSTNAPLELNLASFKIKEIGWRLKVSDSFFLINRYSKPEGENISPSSFKGAPGVSLLFSYGSNNNDDCIFGMLEPSLGINVSYIDFYTNKDLEVGVGGVLGIFNNQVFFTVGYNLHSESQGGYYGLGFSFANIASQIK